MKEEEVTYTESEVDSLVANMIDDILYKNYGLTNEDLEQGLFRYLKIE